MVAGGAGLIGRVWPWFSHGWPLHAFLTATAALLAWHLYETWRFEQKSRTHRHTFTPGSVLPVWSALAKVGLPSSFNWVRRAYEPALGAILALAILPLDLALSCFLLISAAALGLKAELEYYRWLSMIRDVKDAKVMGAAISRETGQEERQAVIYRVYVPEAPQGPTATASEA